MKKQIILALVLLGLISCSNDEKVETIPSNKLERIEIYTQGILVYKIPISYGNNGFVKKIVVSRGEELDEFFYTYDKKGNIINIKHVSDLDLKYGFEQEQGYDCFYDESNKLSRKYMQSRVDTLSYTDSTGKVITEYFDSVSEEKFSYDEKGNISKMEYTSKKYKMPEKEFKSLKDEYSYLFEYDEKGRVIKETYIGEENGKEKSFVEKRTYTEGVNPFNKLYPSNFKRSDRMPDIFVLFNRKGLLASRKPERSGLQFDYKFDKFSRVIEFNAKSVIDGIFTVKYIYLKK